MQKNGNCSQTGILPQGPGQTPITLGQDVHPCPKIIFLAFGEDWAMVGNDHLSVCVKLSVAAPPEGSQRHNVASRGSAPRSTIRHEFKRLRLRLAPI